MAIEIKYKTEETFKFPEFEFKTSKRKIKEITVKAPCYQDRMLLVSNLPENPTSKEALQAMMDLAIKKTGLSPEEFLELPEPIAEAIIGFLNPSN